jgi:hypothetical protein
MTDPGDRSGKSPHAFMREALDAQTKLREQRHALVVAAHAAEAEAFASGMGYTAEAVEAYFAVRTQQLPAAAPPLASWRK